MDPRRLELLLELSRLGSMREVGEAMQVTTSTVSQQIAALAREAGVPLIEPDGRRVRLTPAGQRLAGHAVTILAALEAARLDLVRDMILAGLGVGLLPAPPPTGRTARGVTLRRLDEPDVTQRPYAVTRRGRSAWPPLALVLRLLQDTSLT